MSERLKKLVCVYQQVKSRTDRNITALLARMTSIALEWKNARDDVFSEKKFQCNELGMIFF